MEGQDTTPEISKDVDASVDRARHGAQMRERVLDLEDAGPGSAQRGPEHPRAKPKRGRENRRRKKPERPAAPQCPGQTTQEGPFFQKKKKEEREARRGGRALLREKSRGVADKREKQNR